MKFILPAKGVLLFVLLLPLGYSLWQMQLILAGQPHDLGADPGKALVLLQGEWALRYLLLTLLISPLRRFTGWSVLLRFRRMIGVTTFLYALCHVMAYFAFLLEWRFDDLIDEIIERPYILVGALAFFGLLPLAATSFDWAVRRMKRRWQKLHYLVYPTSMLVLIHLYWLTRSDYTEVVVYGLVLATVLFERVVRLLRKKPTKASSAG